MLQKMTPSKMGNTSPYLLQKNLAQKRVLYVINANSGGGVEQLAASLQSDPIFERAFVQTLYLYPDLSISKSQKIAQLFKVMVDIFKFKPDMLITFQPTSSVIASFMTRLRGCKIRIIHQSNLPSLTHSVIRKLDRLAGSYGFYNAVIMNSAATQSEFKDYPRSYRKNLCFIPHGLSFTAPTQSKQALRKTFGYAPSAKILFCCARLSEEKSIHTILEALALLPERIKKDTFFILAGDGALKQDLQDLAKALGLQNRVLFLGHINQKQLFDYHRAADLFVFPSTSETFGMAALEAAISGLPVIASNIAPLREILQLKGQSASLFVKDWQGQSWADAIEDALKQEDLSARAQNLAQPLRDFYSIAQMHQNYHGLYQDLLL